MAEGNSYVVATRPEFSLGYEHDEQGGWIVYERKTGDWGDGPTLLDAMRDFYTAAAQMLEVLREESPYENQRWHRDYLAARLRQNTNIHTTALPPQLVARAAT
jgi:hypothetical protein